MKCSPRVVSLQGIHSTGDNIEYGNHLRTFIGVEHGFPADLLKVYRRPSTKGNRYINGFRIPITKGILLYQLNQNPSKKVKINIQTSAPFSTLPAEIQLDEASNLLTYRINFHGLVGFLTIQAQRNPIHIFKWLNSWLDRLRKASSFISPKIKSTRGKSISGKIMLKTPREFNNRSSTTAQKNFGFIGEIISVLSRFLSYCLRVILKWQTINLVALYEQEFVAEKQSDSQGRLSLINIPLDEIHLTAPAKYGIELEFILMENDSESGGWMEVETVPCGGKVLDLANNSGNSSDFIEDYIKRHFWSDVHNRFLDRKPEDSEEAWSPAGWRQVERLYAGEQFKEFLELLELTFKHSGIVRQLIPGSRSVTGQRNYIWNYAIGDYDPEELGFLLVLSMDVNIATLLGLHIVDRGQINKLQHKIADKDESAQYIVADVRQKWDYRVEGFWPHLEETYSYVFYDIHESTTPDISGKKIEESSTLDGVEIFNNERFFKVGLNWDITDSPQAPLLTAYDIIRNNQRITEQAPVTPARAEEPSQAPQNNSETIPFNNSLPSIPPFTKPREVKGNKYLYIDNRVQYGTATYAVESVDIHGRVSHENRIHTHSVSLPVLIPSPCDLRVEINKTPADTFSIVARWEWLEPQRELTPDLSRFELFVHRGIHNMQFNGAILWVESTGESRNNLEVTAVVDKRISPIPITTDTNPDHILLRYDEQDYEVENLSIATGPREEVAVFRGVVRAKNRRVLPEALRLKNTARGLLIKRQPNGVLNLPFLSAEQVDLSTISMVGAEIQLKIFVGSSKSESLYVGELVILQTKSFVVLGSVYRIEPDGSVIDGVRATEVVVSINSAWANLTFPIPGNPCNFRKEVGYTWIDWDDANNWSAGPFSVDLPSSADYPLPSDQGRPVREHLNIRIRGDKDPYVNIVSDDDGCTDWQMTNLIIGGENLAVASAGLLVGCKVENDGFLQSLKQNNKGTNPQLVLTVPDNLDSNQLQTVVNTKLKGQTVTLSGAHPSFYSADVKKVLPEAGQTTIHVELPSSVSIPLEWRLCAVKAKPYAITTDSGEISVGDDHYGDSDYHFPIINWRKIDESGKEFEFEIQNILIKNKVDIDGVEEEEEFEITVGIDTISIEVPKLQVASFNITASSRRDFYREVDGGEIGYQVKIDPGLPTYNPDNPDEPIEVLSTAVAVNSGIMVGEAEYIEVAFYPALHPTLGFRDRVEDLTSDTIFNFYPSFKKEIETDILTEDALRKNEPFYATVRAVVGQEGDYEFKGNMAPAVQVRKARGLTLTPPDSPTIDDENLPAIYAIPGPAGSTYTLTWSPSTNAYEYKVYRISKEDIDLLRGKVGTRDETDIEVINDFSRMENVISLRNKSILRQTNFTDVFEGRGAGHYYYKIIAVDKVGNPNDLKTSWATSLILPDPDNDHPVIVLNTVPPDTPTLFKVMPGENKVTLEWQSDPRTDEYWIYRKVHGIYENDHPIKVPVASLERVPLVVGEEKMAIRFKDETSPIGETFPKMDLFFAPDMYKLIGLYKKADYEEWLKDQTLNITNYLQGAAGNEVTIIGRDGSTVTPKPKLPDDAVWIEEDSVRKPFGPDMAIEYLVEEERALKDPYKVTGGQIELASGQTLPFLEGESAMTNVPLFDYATPANCILGVYKTSEYDADPLSAVNYYAGGATFDGMTITGIGLPDGEEVIIITRLLRIFNKTALDYKSLRIEGYPQATRIQSIKIIVNNQVTNVPISDLAFEFNPTNPDRIKLPGGTIPVLVLGESPPPVIINYIDDSGLTRTIKVDARPEIITRNISDSQDELAPLGLSPYIKELVGVWKVSEYNEAAPDMLKEMVVSNGTNSFKWLPGNTEILIHSNIDIQASENGEKVPMVVRFRDHLNQERSVKFIPGRFRYVDSEPYMNIETGYQIKAVRSLNYIKNDEPVTQHIQSGISNEKKITIKDPNPPVPPELTFIRIDNGTAIFSCPVTEGIIEYQLERNEDESPFWRTIGDPVPSYAEETEIEFRDSNYQSGVIYNYRLRVRGANSKNNLEFKVLHNVIYS